MKVHRTALFAAAESDTPTSPTGGAGSAGQAEAPLTLGAQLKAMLKDKTTLQSEVEKAKADLKAATDQVTDLKAKLQAAESERDKLKADMAEVTSALEGAQKEVKDLAAKEQNIDRRASDQAKLIVQGAGIEAGKLPAAASDNMQPRTLAELQAEYGKIEDASKAADFYAQHIEPLLNRR